MGWKSGDSIVSGICLFVCDYENCIFYLAVFYPPLSGEDNVCVTRRGRKLKLQRSDNETKLDTSEIKNRDRNLIFIKFKYLISKRHWTTSREILQKKTNGDLINSKGKSNKIESKNNILSFPWQRSWVFFINMVMITRCRAFSTMSWKDGVHAAPVTPSLCIYALA